MKQEPQRLVEDPGTAALLRDDLARMRGAEPVYDEQRQLQRLHAALVGAVGTAHEGSGEPSGVGSAGPSPATPPLIASGTSALNLGTWLAFGVGSAALLTTAVMVARTAEPGAGTHRTETTFPMEEAPPASPPLQKDRATGTAPLAQPEAAQELVPVANPKARRDRAPASRAAREAPLRKPTLPAARVAPPEEPGHLPPADITDEDANLRREIEHLARARGLLESNPAEAFSVLERGTREFPRGMFDEERAALSIIALDRLGRRHEAIERAQRFLAHHSQGAFVQRVRRIITRTPSP